MGLGRRLGGFGVVVLGLNVMAVGEVSMMRGVGMLAFGRVLVRLVVVLGGMLVVLRGVGVMLGGGVMLIHGSSP